jgi:hypothetical protein
MIHVKTNNFLNKPGKIWKQDVQLRPASKHITLIDCDFYLVDIGDMAWRKPAHMVDRVDVIECTIEKGISLQPGVGVVTVTDSWVHGKLVNKTLETKMTVS